MTAKRVFMDRWMMKACVLAVLFSALAGWGATGPAPLPFRDTSLSFDQRVDDLLSRMTLEEKITQLRSASAAVPRFEIPAYQWWTECLHGVTYLFAPRTATCFPQSTVMAASWDPDLMQRVGDCISDEARARHHVWHANGLTVYTPNINLMRDPRWGRALETYGEDPFLISRMGVALIRGLQGDNPKYLKMAATAKHYCVHSGPETKRRSFNATVGMRDLYESYLPAFKSAVQEGKVAMVMTAYNEVNGIPCTANSFLIQDVLRKQFGFEGMVMSDDQAASDVCSYHHKAKSQQEGGAMVLNAGCDQEVGQAAFAHLAQTVAKGLSTESRVTEACRRALMIRFRLGMFDPPAQVPYSAIPISVVGGEKSRSTALQMAREGLVLLKNQDRTLPLNAAKLKTIAVIGPNADCEQTFISTYFWDKPTASVTPLAGLRKRLEGKAEVRYLRGCDWETATPVTAPIPKEEAAMLLKWTPPTGSNAVEQAAKLAAECDATVLFMGTLSRQSHSSMEGEWIDRKGIVLPAIQETLLRAVTAAAAGKPVVLVTMSGGPLSCPWADEHVPAILHAGFPGQEGGTAVAEALVGDFSPGGKLPYTVYRGESDIPAFENYGMEGRTYRFFKGKPLYPFGHGLSYTHFKYRGLDLPKTLADTAENAVIKVAARISNTGDRDGDEVVQLYLKALSPSVRAPQKTLVAFQRIHLKAGETQVVTLEVKRGQFQLFADDGKAFVEPGQYEIQLGSSSDDIRLKAAIRVK